MNNGTCIDGGPEFRCECPRGWKGTRCELEDGSCALSPCHNDAHCVNLVADYFCVCPEGVNGKNCEIAPNRCIGEPCHNGGVCGDFGSHLECTCPKGLHYSLKVSICLGVPPSINPSFFEIRIRSCRVMHVQSVLKTCFVRSSDFVGSGCQYELDACQENICQNDGKCVPTEQKGYKCICEPGSFILKFSPALRGQQRS